MTCGELVSDTASAVSDTAVALGNVKSGVRHLLLRCQEVLTK
jgi:hypothetical protein